jgi:hypothetical protein
VRDDRDFFAALIGGGPRHLDSLCVRGEAAVGDDAPVNESCELLLKNDIRFFSPNVSTMFDLVVAIGEKFPFPARWIDRACK